MRLFFIGCFGINIILYLTKFRLKLKLKKAKPPNKPKDFIYNIINEFEDVDMAAYSVAKFNLTTQDKLSRFDIISIFLLFIIPYPIIRLEWVYEKEMSFLLTDVEFQEINNMDDVISCYNKRKHIIDTEELKENLIIQKINKINNQNGKY